jgi:hypothetical protein
MLTRQIEKILEDFFDENKPCPDEIPLCEDVRRAYNAELQKINSSQCNQCAKNNVKSKFIEALWKEIISNTTSKAS